MSRRRSHWGSIMAGAVVIVAGFGIAVVEALKMPKGSIWIVIAAALLLILVIRRAIR